MEKIKITKKELIKLYINQNKTRDEISEIYNCHERTIGRKIKKYNIKKPKELKKYKKIEITKEELIELYINQNKGQNELSEIYNCGRSTIKRKLKKYNIKKPKELTNIKKKETYLKNYGVEHPSQSDEIKNKKKETCLKNYGVEHPAQSDEIKEKMKKTTLKNYGVEHPAQSDEIKNKIKETTLKNHGVECSLQSEEVKNKSKETCLNKYGVEHPTQKHIENYGIWNDDELFYKWVKNKSNELGRKVCSGDVAEFFNVYIEGTAIFKLHTLDNIKGSNKYYNIRESYFESLIEDWLKINNINYKKNNRTIIKPLELDFVLPDYNIAIEMNDTWSHNIQFKMNMENEEYLDALYYHENKLKLAKEKGYFLIHIYEKDLDDLDSIIKPILENKPDMDEINSKVYWVKGDDWVYDDDVIDLSDKGYVMVVDSNWF